MSEQGERETCGEQYGHNPDACYRERGHKGPHWNKWGTTWAQAEQWKERVRPSPWA